MAFMGSTGWEKPLEFDFLGLECDPSILKQSEAKNLFKMAVFDARKFCQNLLRVHRPNFGEPIRNS